MENQTQPLSEKPKKFLLMAPVLVLPFLTLFFWAMGGGKTEQVAATEVSMGINNKLPDARLKEEKGLDKMAFYDQAAKDSLKAVDQSGNPGNAQALGKDSGAVGLSFPAPISTGSSITMNTSPYAGGGYNDPNEMRINQRLQQLDQLLNQQQMASAPQNKNLNPAPAGDNESLQRLEKMMQQMQGSSPDEDAETQQLDGMLEKVLDLQYPERVQEKIRKSSELHKGQVFAVGLPGKRQFVSSLEGPKNAHVKTGSEGNGFFSTEEQPDSEIDQNAIDAVVSENQTLVNGSTVKLRLLDDIYINGKLIPKNNFIYGTAALNGERLAIKIDGIRFKKSLFPVALSVIDIDGIDGIYIPGAIAREVAKESTDRAIQDVNFGSMSPSIGVQAAGAGVEAAKSLFSKKVRLIKVTLKAGYKVLLRDEKQKQGNQ
ncbi:conjugative transposon protein TraM [Pedobacter sp. GR22-10]|uniref:conjugative transposon protein TraM n=1 Tax=Pedobacter sp. GR22-10 TaxID=2994472 RepID=UPI002247258E|nr:conjugative transposon protein TraM [Pedobacter sp. GR22-10]MCX2429924.1 conjugative transposon protein TraM [Pedobacter sp. GR22-10]